MHNKGDGSKFLHINISFLPGKDFKRITVAEVDRIRNVAA